MKSNYEIQQIKGLKILQLTENAGAGIIKTKQLPKASVIWTRHQVGRMGKGTTIYNHVSMAPEGGIHIPTWQEMCILKDLFYNDEEEVYQIHPKKSEYVNILDNCLHLWEVVTDETRIPKF